MSAALAATLEPGDRLYACVGRRRIVTGTFNGLTSTGAGDVVIRAEADGRHLELAPADVFLDGYDAVAAIR